MNIFFDNLFGKKSKTKGEVEIVTSSENKDIDTQSGVFQNTKILKLRKHNSNDITHLFSITYNTIQFKPNFTTNCTSPLKTALASFVSLSLL